MSFLKIKRKGESKVNNEPIDIAPLPKNQLGISPEAVQRLQQLLANEAPEQQYFRVAIRGGGCSGLSIHYEFGQLRPNDLVFSREHVNVCIDPKSLSILGGSTLHFRGYLGSGEFILVNNPAEKQCSCGQSFSL